jgi:hypothetical protein
VRHRVVGPAVDSAIVHQEGVGDSREPLDGFLLFEDYGLLAPVSAGGDDGRGLYGSITP